MPVSEELKIVVKADAQNAITNLNRVQGTTTKATSSFMSMAKSLIGPIGVAVAVGAVAKKFGEFAMSSIRFNAEMEQTNVAFETMLGSAERATALLDELTEFSAATPFQLQDLTEGAQRLLAFGTEAKDVRDVLQDLGNAAQGQGDKLDRLVNAYGKLQAKGRASLEELNMFTEAGVPIMQALQDQIGLTKEELFDYVTKGKIGFEDVNEALQSLTRGEGQFAGMLEKQSQTLAGSVSTLKDNIKLLGGQIFSVFTPAITKAVQGMTSFVGKIREMLDTKSETDRYIKDFSDNIIELGNGLYTAILNVGTLTEKTERLLEAFQLDQPAAPRTPDDSATRLKEAYAKTTAAQLTLLEAELAYFRTTDWGNRHVEKRVAITEMLEEQIKRLRPEIVATEKADIKFSSAQMQLSEGTSWARQKFVELDATIMAFQHTSLSTIDTIYELAGSLDSVVSSLQNLGNSWMGGAGAKVLEAFEALGRGDKVNWDDVIDDIASSLLRNLSTLLLGAGLITMFIFPPLGIALLALAGVSAFGAGAIDAGRHRGPNKILDEKKAEDYVPPESQQVGTSGFTINVYGDVNDADRFAEKVGEVITRRYATA